MKFSKTLKKNKSSLKICSKINDDIETVDNGNFDSTSGIFEQVVFLFSFSSAQMISKVNLLNSLSDNFTKWSNTLKQFVGNLPTTCLSVFDHFVRLALKGLTQTRSHQMTSSNICINTF